MLPEYLYNLIDFNIDRHLNPYLPRNHLYILPKPVSHFLGYRSAPSKEPPTTVQWVLTGLGTVAGLCVVGAVFTHAPGIATRHPPPIIASLGASAVLDYNTIRSPLAQPRNAIVGHTLAAIVGVAIAKLFMLDMPFFLDYGWVAAAVACAAASLIMTITGTVHPPGGATAILACTEAEVIGLGWMYPPIMLLASVLMLGVACMFNNTLRQYPVFWWTPEETGHKLPWYRRRDGHNRKDEEWSGDDDSAEVDDKPKESTSQRSFERTFSDQVQFVEGLEEVHVAPYLIRMPPHLELSEEEEQMFQSLMMRMRRRMELAGE